MLNAKMIATPRLSVIAPREENREAVEKINERKLMLEQMKLDIGNMTVAFMHEGFSYEEAKSKAEGQADTVKGWIEESRSDK